MLIFEAIFAFLRRSLGSVLRAMFGWATLALFGEVREKERPLLTLVVAAAAVWPLLLVGHRFPAAGGAASRGPAGARRARPNRSCAGVWIALTLLIPLGRRLGALTRRKRRGPKRRSRWKRLLLGFPTTLGLGLGFLFVCVAVPVRKVRGVRLRPKGGARSLWRFAPEDYTETVAKLREALTRGGVPVEPREPPWGTRALGRLLHVFAGAVLSAYQPENLEYLCTDEIEMTFYPNGVRLYGGEAVTARAHALLAESATATPALLCMSPDGQEIEHRVKMLWKRRAERNARLDRDVQALARELADTTLGFRDWETLYRELLQVVVASRGASRLIQTALAGRAVAAPEGKGEPRRVPVRRLRRAARRARAYSGATLRKEASDRSLKLIEKLAERVFGILTRRALSRAGAATRLSGSPPADRTPAESP